MKITVKDKANELYSKFEDEILELEGEVWYKSASRCAVRCIDEILKELDNFDGMDRFVKNRINYYEEVKEEIIKLVRD